MVAYEELSNAAQEEHGSRSKTEDRFTKTVKITLRVYHHLRFLASLSAPW
jgi:hypothetical protein